MLFPPPAASLCIDRPNTAYKCAPCWDKAAEDSDRDTVRGILSPLPLSAFIVSSHAPPSAIALYWHLTMASKRQEKVLVFKNKAFEPVHLFRVRTHGEELYGQLEHKQRHSLVTSITSRWRLRLASTGDLVGEYGGCTAQVVAKGLGHLKIKTLEEVYHPKPKWGSWRVRAVSAQGIPILAHAMVLDAPIRIACKLLSHMLDHSSSEVLRRLLHARVEVGIIGSSQEPTDLPIHAFYKLWSDKWAIDASKGVEGSQAVPAAACRERDLTMQGDRAPCDSALVFYFGLTVMAGHMLRPYPQRFASSHLPLLPVGLGSQDQEKLAALHKRALASGVYKQNGGYFVECVEDYWGLGCLAWFEATASDVSINTRERLKRYDPGLAEMMCKAFGDGPWRFTHDAPKALVPPRGGLAALSSGLLTGSGFVCRAALPDLA